MSASMQKSCLVLLVVLVFGQGLFGDFVWDDRALTTDNPAFSGSFSDAVSTPFLLDSGGGGSYWRPVVTGALWLQVQAFGEGPFGYHLISLVLHALITLLVFSWLRRRVGGEHLGAFVGAALFAVHSSRPESVSWIAGSTDLWMALFVLLGARLWDSERPFPGKPFMVGICLSLALWSKETALVVLPLLVLEGLWSKKPQTLRAGALATIPLALALAFRLWMGEGAGGGSEGISTRLALGLSALGHYLHLVAWPFELSVMVGPREMVGGVEQFSTVWMGTGVLLMTLIGVGWWRAGKSADSCGWRSDILWFILPLLPVLHLIPLGTPWTAAARYLYLPLVGVCCLCARWAARDSRGVVVCAVLALVFAAGSWTHTAHFESDKVLWAHELERTPSNVTAGENLGHALYRAGEKKEALDAWTQGLKSATEGNPSGRSRLGLLVLREQTTNLSPDDPEGLSAAHALYQQLAAGESIALAEADLPSFDSGGVEDPELLWIPAGQAAQAAGAYPDAEQWFVRALTRRPSSQLAWAESIRTSGLAGDWNGVASGLARVRKTLGQPGWGVALEQQLSRARQMAENMPLPPDASEAVGKALKQSRLASLLGSDSGAWSALVRAGEAGGEQTISYWVTRVQWEVSRGNQQAAFATLGDARKALPAAASKWDAFEAQLRSQMPSTTP